MRQTAVNQLAPGNCRLVSHAHFPDSRPTMDSLNAVRIKTWPWVTVVIAVAALLTFAYPKMSDVFIYER